MQPDNGGHPTPKRAVIRVNYVHETEFALGRGFAGLADRSADEKDIGRKLLLAVRKDVGHVLFAGGDAALWPPLPKILRLAQKIGLEASIQSDAGRISSREMAETLKRYGLSGIETSIGGYDAATHATLFPGASFERCITGLKHCRDAELKISITVPLHAGNINHTAEIVAALEDLAPQSISFQLPDPADFFDRNLSVPMLKAAAELRRAFAEMHHKGLLKRFNISYGGLPVCFLPDFGELNSDASKFAGLEISELSDSAFTAFAFPERLHAQACSECRHRGECPGPYVSAADRDSVEPRPQPVSNSITFVAEGMLDYFHVEHCPILSGALSIDDFWRCILLDRGHGKAEIYRTSSADFGIDELRRFVHELGQLYLDVSGKIYHYDFEKELSKLTPHRICRKCPQRPHCPALHTRVEENLFRKAELSFLKQLDEKIRGRVMDVGCGSVRSRGVVDRLLDDKLIEYFAVEPSPPETLREFLKQHKIEDNLYVGQIEHYRTEAGSFDWILLLCSYNHLYDLDAALRAMHTWLKPGGRLLILENVAYGVLRERSIWERISRIEGCTCFEHYHNHTSQEALKHVLAAGFTLESEIPVSGDTANQWQIIARRD